MNKNRVNEGQPLHSAAQPLKKRPAENFLVFIILAAVILALNMFSSRPGAVEQNHLPDPAEPEEMYVWLSGFPGTREGLHRFTPEQLRNNFPAIAALLADMAAPAADYPVHAFQYQDDTVEQINPPPAVANIFFNRFP